MHNFTQNELLLIALNDIDEITSNHVEKTIKFDTQIEIQLNELKSELEQFPHYDLSPNPRIMEHILMSIFQDEKTTISKA